MHAPAATTWDDRLFSFEVGADDSGERVRITVRRADRGEERFADVPPEGFAAATYESVVDWHVTALRTALGYVEPEPFGPDEFLINHYCCTGPDGGAHGACDIVHAPTGRRSVMIDHRHPGDTPARVAVEREMEQLMRGLRADGIAPQPRPGSKKIGKPRRKVQHAGGAVD